MMPSTLSMPTPSPQHHKVPGTDGTDNNLSAALGHMEICQGGISRQFFGQPASHKQD